MSGFQQGVSYIAHLRCALQDPDLDVRPVSPLNLDLIPPAALRAAERAALALGHCSLAGVSIPEDLPPVLPWNLARMAALAWSARLQQANQQTGALRQRGRAPTDPHAADQLGIDLLQTRMAAWAGFVAIDRAYAHGLETGESDNEVDQALLDKLLGALEDFDAALLAQEERLCMIAHLPLLQEWRQLLAAPFRDPLPWWLDGTLEAAAREMQRRALALPPDNPIRQRLPPDASA